jgi:hypothetical protein
MSNRKEGVFNIKIEKLFLDQLNPRLYGESAGESQDAIMEKIYSKESIDELASSLAVNGYFQEEPIIVVPKLEANYDLINENNFNDFDYIVVEGNRRTTSVKLLLNDNNSIVDSDFPKILNPNMRLNLSEIPSILYKKREDVDIYLSIRHITGNRKWDAFAKAKYIYDKVNKINLLENNISNSISILSNQIGDKSNVIRKNYIYYKIFQSIESDVLNYKTKHIKDRFSLLEVALASGNTSISNFIGVHNFKSLDLESDIIQPNKVDELTDLTVWIFGKDESGDGKLISESRSINQFLKPILENQEATEHLREYGDVEGAFQLTDGEERLVVGNVKRANKLISTILGRAKKYKTNDEFLNSLVELKDTIDSLEKIIS